MQVINTSPFEIREKRKKKNSLIFIITPQIRDIKIFIQARA